jgi:hypothetical protein
MSAYTIPQEVIDAVIDEVGGLRPLKLRRRLLRSCALAGPAFAPRSQLHIFSKLSVRRAEQCLVWAARLQESPRIGRYVQELELLPNEATGQHLGLKGWGPALPDLFKACPTLSRLTLTRIDLLNIPSVDVFHEMVTNVQYLTMKHCFTSYAVLEQFLCSFPRLQDVKLGELDVVMIHSPSPERPTRHLRRLEFMPGMQMGAGGAGYGIRLGRTIGVLQELQIMFDGPEHYEFVQDIVTNLQQGPSHLRLLHSPQGYDSPSTERE